MERDKKEGGRGQPENLGAGHRILYVFGLFQITKEPLTVLVPFPFMFSI